MFWICYGVFDLFEHVSKQLHCYLIAYHYSDIHGSFHYYVHHHVLPYSDDKLPSWIRYDGSDHVVHNLLPRIDYPDWNFGSQSLAILHHSYPDCAGDEQHLLRVSSDNTVFPITSDALS